MITKAQLEFLNTELRNKIAQLQAEIKERERVLKNWMDLKAKELSLVLVEELDKQIKHLQAENGELWKIVKSFRDNLPVNCLCDEAYKSRKLTDPNCQYCYWEEELNAIKELEGERNE